MGERWMLRRHDRYICRHRTLWYTQVCRPPTPFVCTYLGRSDNKSGRPFRFILNNSKATAANVYLMLYPKEPIKSALQDRPELKRQVWELLNEICPQAMLGEDRVYGGVLHKLEPKELGNVPAEESAELLFESSLLDVEDAELQNIFSLYFSPRGEAKWVRGLSGRGASRLTRAGVLEQYVEHGKQAQRSPGGRIACFGRRVVRNAG